MQGRASSRYGATIAWVGGRRRSSAGRANGAWAQAYPHKPVRLVVPFAPGGTTDIIARVLYCSVAAQVMIRVLRCIETLSVVAGLQFPEAVATTLQRIGLAALPLGLMATGAGLLLGRLKAGPGLAAALMLVRHAVLPLVAIGLTTALALPPAQRTIVVLFAALPTASSAYVLAARMGGDGGYVAGLVTLSTLLGMLSVPFWLAMLAQLQ